MEKQELHIDFEAAKAAFETYLDEYDRTDDKIHLKIVLLCGRLCGRDRNPDASGTGRCSVGEDHRAAARYRTV